MTGEVISGVQFVQFVQVRASAVDDVRRAVFLALDGSGLSPARQRALANGITAKLRAQGLLASGLEQLHKAVDLAGLLSRTPEHVVAEAKLGRFGVVYRDAGGWLIPESGAQAWLDRRQYVPAAKEIAA